VYETYVGLEIAFGLSFKTNARRTAREGEAAGLSALNFIGSYAPARTARGWAPQIPLHIPAALPSNPLHRRASSPDAGGRTRTRPAGTRSTGR